MSEYLSELLSGFGVDSAQVTAGRKSLTLCVEAFDHWSDPVDSATTTVTNCVRYLPADRTGVNR